MSEARATAWAMMMQAALRMGVTPEAFWRLSLKEWRMLTEGAPAPAMGRGEFERLTALWPDDETERQAG